jgi:hypothetical protein
LEKIENIRGRRNIKNGLKNCEIKQVDPNLFAQEAYPIYVESLVSYGYLKSEIPEPSKFNKEIILKSQYAGTRYWAAYAEGTMIAYSTCFEVDGGVSLGSTKSLKAFQKLNANSALFYEICKYYLGEGQALYVSNGRTNLLHPTKINDFLELIGFRKIYGKLNLELSTIAKIVHVTRIGTWGKYILLPKIKPKLWGKIEGFSKLMEIEKSF